MGIGSLAAALALAVRSSRGPSRLRLFGGAIVMSVYSLVFGGVTPIGAHWAGAVTEATSPAVCMSIAGGIGLVAAGMAILFIRKHPPAIATSPEARAI